MKSWWNEEMHQLHIIACLNYSKYRDSEFNENLKKPYTDARNDFKNYKKLTIKVKNDKKLNELRKMFQFSKNDFWNRVKKMQRKTINIDAKIEQIQKEFSDIFNTRNEKPNIR